MDVETETRAIFGDYYCIVDYTDLRMLALSSIRTGVDEGAVVTCWTSYASAEDLSLVVQILYIPEL